MIYPIHTNPFIIWEVFSLCNFLSGNFYSKITYTIFHSWLSNMLERNIQTDFTFFFLFSTDHAHKGNLYTLFLHSPMSAFCFVTNVVDIPIHLWDKCLAYIDRFMTEASRLITRCRGVGKSMKQNKCWILIHRSTSKIGIWINIYSNFLKRYLIPKLHGRWLPTIATLSPHLCLLCSTSSQKF